MIIYLYLCKAWKELFLTTLVNLSLVYLSLAVTPMLIAKQWSIAVGIVELCISRLSTSHIEAIREFTPTNIRPRTNSIDCKL